jgi:hypothetical protein
MRIALAVLASGFALGLSAPSYADESVPDPTRFATPQPVTASQVDTGKYCHHMIHEGALNVVRCRSAQSWELTRLETQQTIIDFQHHSYVTPGR